MQTIEKVEDILIEKNLIFMNADYRGILHDSKEVVKAVKQIRNMMYHGRESGKMDRMVIYVYCITLDFVEMVGSHAIAENIREEMEYLCRINASSKYITPSHILICAPPDLSV